jgi:hypothetical protein
MDPVTRNLMLAQLANYNPYVFAPKKNYEFRTTSKKYASYFGG